MNDHIYHIIYIRVRVYIKMILALMALAVYLIITFLPSIAFVTALVKTSMPIWGRLLMGIMGVLASIMGRPLTIFIKSLKNI